MSAAQTIIHSHMDRILEDAVCHHRRVSLTEQTPAGWRTFTSQFAGCSSSPPRVVLEGLVPRDPESTSGLPKPGTTLGVAFRTNHKKCMFMTILEDVEEREDNTRVILHWPERIQQLRRRAFERARPPKGLVIAVRFWLEPDAGRPGVDARAVRHGQLEDLSAGGMRVRVAEVSAIELGTTYRCAFTSRPGKPPILVDAVAKHREAVEHGRASVGFQFVGLEGTAPGAQILERLARTVSQFQRGRSRRRKRSGPGRVAERRSADRHGV